MYVFMYVCVYVIVIVCFQMFSRNLMVWSVLIGAAMLIAMGLAGYLSFRSATNEQILNNFTGHAADPFKLLIVIHLVGLVLNFKFNLRPLNV